ncbi:hypothetical protein CFP56_030816 [Quercus suber]|uniref:Uncharacterized protein n=1 Tax=Quercus suber TaxID=58331 RepID=A0AAW0JLF0_QUESU
MTYKLYYLGTNVVTKPIDSLGFFALTQDMTYKLYYLGTNVVTKPIDFLGFFALTQDFWISILSCGSKDFTSFYYPLALRSWKEIKKAWFHEISIEVKV